MPNINGPFDGQIVLNFTEQSHAPVDSGWLEKRWQQTYPNKPHIILDAYQYLNDINSRDNACDNYFKKNDAVRIYIVLHADPGAEKVPIYNDESQSYLTVEELAEILKVVIGNHQNAVVNLIACNAARGEKNNPYTATEKSFASRLHEQLYLQTKRDIPVVARPTVTYADSKGKKYTSPVNSVMDDTTTLKKQPKSKLVFFAEKGVQVCEDAYKVADEKNKEIWREAVLKARSETFDEITDEQTKTVFNNEFMYIEMLEPDDLYVVLQKIQTNPEFQKIDHEFQQKTYFFYDNPIKKMLEDLLRQGQELFQNQNNYLPKTPVKHLK